MAEKKTRNIKKKWGKVLQLDQIIRSSTIDEEKSQEIAKYLDSQKVVTPQQLADKQGIRVSLARDILQKYEADGALELKFKNGSNEIYSK